LTESSKPAARRGLALAAMTAVLLEGGIILHHVHSVRMLPLWTYLAFLGVLCVFWFSVWILATGTLPGWALPETPSPLRFFHPRIFFWESWQEVSRGVLSEGKRRLGYEVIVVTLVSAFSLTLVEYFGDRMTIVRLWPEAVTGAYGDLAVFGWWSLTRFVCYAVIPSLSILLTPALRWRNCGLAARGFSSHLWIYGVLFAVVLPVVIFISYKEDFKDYYPFYDFASRSWFDFLAWEFFYFVQFLSLEFLFRGYIIHPLKKYMGAYAIFLMVLPYCMIHYGKPYLEPNAAIVAGVVLGTLSLRTGSIWCGCLIHISVALTMDLAALAQKGALAALLKAPFFFHP
jgi:membrane protease YdiL (CAAX protease family)